MNTIKLKINEEVLNFGVSDCHIGLKIPIIDKKPEQNTIKNFAILNLYDATINDTVYLIQQDSDSKYAEITTINNLSGYTLENFCSLLSYNGQTYWVINNYFTPFVLLNENEEIQYPLNAFPCKPLIECALNKQPLYSIKMSVSTQLTKEEILTNQSFIESTVNAFNTGFDNNDNIKRYVEEFVCISCDKSAMNRIKVESIFGFLVAIRSERYKDFYKCIKAGIAEAYTWMQYSEKTVAKKSKDILKLLNPKEELPDYVKKVCFDNWINNSNKNILNLYNIGFSEYDFKTFKALFYSFSDMHISRYMCFRTLFDKFAFNQYSNQDILQIIKENVKYFDCSIATFCYLVESLLGTKCDTVEYGLFDLLVQCQFNEQAYEQLKQKSKDIEKQKVKDSFGKYPDISFSNELFTRISDINQMSTSLSNFISELLQNGEAGFRRINNYIQGDVITFEINADDVQHPFLLAFVDLGKRGYSIVSMARSSLSKVYVTYNDAYLCNDTSVSFKNIIDKFNYFLSEYVYPAYADIKIKEVF